jgi:hypothetical protein
MAEKNSYLYGYTGGSPPTYYEAQAGLASFIGVTRHISLSDQFYFILFPLPIQPERQRWRN